MPSNNLVFVRLQLFLVVFPWIAAAAVFGSPSSGPFVDRRHSSIFRSKISSDGSGSGNVVVLSSTTSTSSSSSSSSYSDQKFQQANWHITGVIQNFNDDDEKDDEDHDSNDSNSSDDSDDDDDDDNALSSSDESLETSAFEFKHFNLDGNTKNIVPVYSRLGRYNLEYDQNEDDSFVYRKQQIRHHDSFPVGDTVDDKRERHPIRDQEDHPDLSVVAELDTGKVQFESSEETTKKKEKKTNTHEEKQRNDEISITAPSQDHKLRVSSSLYVAGEEKNIDQTTSTSIVPYFGRGFSDLFFPTMRIPQPFKLIDADFPTAVPVIYSKQQNREIVRHNCSVLLDTGYLPTGAETFAVLGRWGVLLCCMETVMVLCTLLIFSRECLYLYQHWPPKIASLSCAALSVFPFTSICALSAAIFPHMYDVASALVMLYLPFSLVMYYELVATYAGGCDVLWDLLIDQRMPLKGPPLCCILPPCCGQGPILTRKRQRLMRGFIYQLLGIPALLIGIIFICTLAGVHPGDRLEATNASPYLMLVQALSFVLGTYALVICVKLAARHMPQHALRRKFTVFHLHYTVTRLQVIFFKLTGLTSTLPCIPPLSSMASGIYMSCAVLIGQCFLMSTVSQYFFLHTPPQSPVNGPIVISEVNGKRVHCMDVDGSCRNCGASPLTSQNVDYSDETFSSTVDPAAAAARPSTNGLSVLAKSTRNPMIVSLRGGGHAPLGRAFSHPVAASARGVSTNNQSLSSGALRPDHHFHHHVSANRANLSLDLKNTHTMTLERRRRRRRPQLRSGSLEELDLELSYAVRQHYLEAERRSQIEQLRQQQLEQQQRFEQQQQQQQQQQQRFEQQQQQQQRRRQELFNPLMTCSLDEALRLRELRERRARLWRVSVAGGERWMSMSSSGRWPVSSLEEVTPLSPGEVFESNAWLDSDRWLRPPMPTDWVSPHVSPNPRHRIHEGFDVQIAAPEWPTHRGIPDGEQFC